MADDPLEKHRQKIEKIITKILNRPDIDFLCFYKISKMIEMAVAEEIKGIKIDQESVVGNAITFNFRNNTEIIGYLLVIFKQMPEFNWYKL